MRVRLETIGCRLNISEIDSMARALASAGHRVVGPGEPVDLCILNTCTVTSIASKKSRQLIRQLRRDHPSAAVVATGCDVELAPEQAREAGVDLVVGNPDKHRLLELAEAEGLLHEPDPDLDRSTVFAPRDGTRTRAFLKVQDGCDNRCTFCIVTVARGAGRSIAVAEVVREIETLVREGYREVVLSGVHLGSYGHDLGDRRGLSHLVEEILTRTALPRLRLSSLEPWDLDPAFFEVFSDPRLLPHLHIPLQSGCDETLKRMARRTSRAELEVGFPGESADEFEASRAFVEEMAFSRLHIFRYSRREGTLASSMPGQVRGPVAQERSRRLHELGADIERRFNSLFIGRRADVLWETAEDLGSSLRWSGLTPNYIRITTETDTETSLLNAITPTDIVEVVPGGVIGRIRN
jgi:threonylcarbamoyladenosine tRNA methylthiotransferase MtaB